MTTINAIAQGAVGGGQTNPITQTFDYYVFIGDFGAATVSGYPATIQLNVDGTVTPPSFPVVLFVENSVPSGTFVSGSINYMTSNDPNIHEVYFFTTEVPEKVPGCTDPAASNYNASANSNDGSCVYPSPPPGPSPPVCTG